MIYKVRLFIAPNHLDPKGTKSKEIPGFVVDATSADAAERVIVSRLETEHPGRVLAVSPASLTDFVATVRRPDA